MPPTGPMSLFLLATDGAGLRVDNANAGATNLAVFQKAAATWPASTVRAKASSTVELKRGCGRRRVDPLTSVGFRCRVMWVMIDVDNPMHHRVADEANSAAVAGVITTKPAC